MNITPGTLFDTEYEAGCVATTFDSEYGAFDGYDSDGVVCQFSTAMVARVHGNVAEAVGAFLRRFARTPFSGSDLGTSCEDYLDAARLIGYDGAEYAVGDRVELHPATDLWVRGARYGLVVSTSLTPKDHVRVLLDATSKKVSGTADTFRKVQGAAVEKTDPDNAGERIALGSLIADLAGSDYVTTDEAAAVVAWCREWAADCEWADVLDTPEETREWFATVDASELLRSAHRHIDGGIAFVLADVRRASAPRGSWSYSDASGREVIRDGEAVHAEDRKRAEVIRLGSDGYVPTRDYLRDLTRSDAPLAALMLATDMLAEAVDLWNVLDALGHDTSGVDVVQRVLGRIASR